MKTSYIYLNTYKTSNGNEYLYVGSHTWDGPEGELDTSYFGSSSIANCFNWSPISIEILEVVSKDRQYIAEKEWIMKYCSMYGIADCAIHIAHSHDNSWVDTFNSHGLMLNCHCNDCAQCNTPEVNAKAQATRKASGYYNTEAFEAIHSLGIKAASAPEVREAALQTMKDRGYDVSSPLHNPEAYRKSWETRKASGQLDAARELSHTPEAQAKRQNTRKENGSYYYSIDAMLSPEAQAKAQATKKANGTNDPVWTRTPEAQAKRIATNRASGALERSIKIMNDASHTPEVNAKRAATKKALGQMSMKECHSPEALAKLDAYRRKTCIQFECEGFVGLISEIVNKFKVSRNRLYRWHGEYINNGTSEFTFNGKTYKIIIPC